MPTYEYRCEKCEQTFEVFQSMKDPVLETCPKEGCGGKVKRLIGTGAGLLFKGSGFYTTDYRSSNYRESAKKETGSKEGSSPKTETKKTESKPESKPASSGN